MRYARPVRLLLGGVAGGLTILSGAGAAPAALSPEPVLTGPPDQITPAAQGTTLAWSQSQNGPINSGGYNEYVRVGSAPRVRVNPPHTWGFGGGISGTTLVYQQFNLQHDTRDIRFYDIATKTYSAPPAGWNTTAEEIDPTISGDLVLFERGSGDVGGSIQRAVYLGNRSTGALRRLVSRPGFQGAVGLGQVNGNYAVWTQCHHPSIRCNVVRYDIATNTKTLIPNTFARGRQQYNPSVTAGGTVYFIHSGNGCGARVKLVRRPVGGPSTVLVRFRRGFDVLYKTYVDDSAPPPVVYYSRTRCSPSARYGNIYKVVD